MKYHILNVAFCVMLGFCIICPGYGMARVDNGYNMRPNATSHYPGWNNRSTGGRYNQTVGGQPGWNANRGPVDNGYNRRPNATYQYPGFNNPSAGRYNQSVGVQPGWNANNRSQSSWGGGANTNINQWNAPNNRTQPGWADSNNSLHGNQGNNFPQQNPWMRNNQTQGVYPSYPRPMNSTGGLHPATPWKPPTSSGAVGPVPYVPVGGFGGGTNNAFQGGAIGIGGGHPGSPLAPMNGGGAAAGNAWNAGGQAGLSYGIGQPQPAYTPQNPAGGGSSNPYANLLIH